MDTNYRAIGNDVAAIKNLNRPSMAISLANEKVRGGRSSYTVVNPNWKHGVGGERIGEEKCEGLKPEGGGEG